MGVLRTFTATTALTLVAAGTPAATPSEMTLRQRYRVPASSFLDVDGTPVHFADEGKGPAIMLVHGSFSSLRQWNGWAKALRKHYRVVRFDLPPAGLSGPSPKADYGVDAKLHIMEALRQKLGLSRFVLVSMSSGGIIGAAYAAQYPQHVSGFIYSNATVGPLQMDTANYPPALKAAVAKDATHKGYHEPELWRQVLLYHFVDKSKVTPALVREWTELNNRALSMPPSPPGKNGITHDRTPGDLAKIEAPVLFLWGADDKEAHVETDARAGMALVPGADKQLIVVPHCGHMLTLDCGDRALTAALPFIRRVTGSGR